MHVDIFLLHAWKKLKLFDNWANPSLHLLMAMLKHFMVCQIVLLAQQTFSSDATDVSSRRNRRFEPTFDVEMLLDN